MSDSFVLQRDTTDLTAENRELKLRLQAMEQQAQLRDGMCSTIHQLVFVNLSRVISEHSVSAFQA